ncbi:protein of unknown function [Methylocaldum szegediense]|uniref:Uncharacterized protein n=1 Tax=Methylocaldum szegediense TaxID=73780 RepID=A0ABN8X6A8_9GAMM|nr:protein of unknown function [Methylocaldum szegediense]
MLLHLYWRQLKLKEACNGIKNSGRRFDPINYNALQKTNHGANVTALNVGELFFTHRSQVGHLAQGPEVAVRIRPG